MLFYCIYVIIYVLSSSDETSSTRLDTNQFAPKWSLRSREKHVPLRDRLEDFVHEADGAERRFNGNAWDRQMIDGMLADLAPHVAGMPSDDDDRYYRSTRLMRLPEMRYDRGMQIGDVRCTRALYVGEDGKLYVEGPRKKLGMTIIDIHPLTVRDAWGWDGISANDVFESLLPFFV